MKISVFRVTFNLNICKYVEPEIRILLSHPVAYYCTNVSILMHSATSHQLWNTEVPERQEIHFRISIIYGK